MKHDKLILAKEVEIGGRTFAISKIPATRAIEIYNVIGDSVNKHGVLGLSILPPSVIKQILAYVNLYDGGDWIEFGTDGVIDSVFREDFGALQQVVIAMVKENFDFFVSGKLLDALAAGETAAETESGS